jgi:DNA-binding HxlR family transcriptional regulator
MEDIFSQFQATPDRLNRDVLESMMQQMLRMLESLGMLEAPQFPSVGVLPLAIYRNVAPVTRFTEAAKQLIDEDEADTDRAAPR